MQGGNKRSVRRCALWLRLGALALAALVYGALAVWIQAPERRMAAEDDCDVVYVVCGARANNRRLDAALDYLRTRDEWPRVWIGDDRLVGAWDSREQRNMTLAEAAERRLREVASAAGHPPLDEDAISIVTGDFVGTDGEMREVARQTLGATPPVKTIALATSPSHRRRCLLALNRRLSELGTAREVHVVFLPGAASWEEWMPWSVLGEALKIVRDSLGLAAMPLVSRTGLATVRAVARGGCFVAVALLVYAWVLYPPLLVFAARVRARRQRRVATGAAGAALVSAAPPPVDVLVAAHNEESVIAERILNLVQQSYPRERIRIWVGCDGCSDATAERARAAAGDDVRVHVVEFAENRGKVSVLKELARLASEARMGEAEADSEALFAFTDANTEFASDALARLTARFADAAVGGVCGRLRLTRRNADGQEVADTEGAYWRMENKLKAWESAVDSCLGANGAIYAMRASLFWSAIPATTIVDDFVLGMKVREAGFRMIYEPGAVATEALPPPSAEWRRRVRIGAGDYQALALCKRCLLPRFGWFAWMFWSHKTLRWFTPQLLLAAWFLAWPLVTPTLGIGRIPFLRAIVWPALCGIAWFVVRLAARRRAALLAPARALDHFLTMQAALFAGFVKYCRGGLKGTWRRTDRDQR